MKKYLIVLTAMLIIACNQPEEPIPENILPKKIMIGLMVDINILESAVGLKKLKDQDKDEMISKYYDSIFKTHRTNKIAFEESMEYYYKHPELLEKIYEDVIDELSKKQAEVQNQDKPAE